MKKTRFSDEQMVAILREADEKAVSEVAKNTALARKRSTRGANTSARSSQPT